MNENYYNEETEIDLVDLMFYLLRQWKTLVVAVVLGVILGGAIYMVKKPAETSEPTPTAEAAEDMIENYKPEQDVKANMDLAYRYRQLYAQQLEYNEKSLIMKMDPGEVYTGELEYYLAAGDNTRLLGELFANILSEEELLSDLKEAADLDCEEQYLNEIISGSIKQDSGVTNSENSVIFQESKNILISYSVSYMDQRACEKMLDVIRNRAETLYQEYRDVYGDYTFTPVNDSVRLVINNDYLNKQKASADAINTYLTNITKLEGSFTGDDLDYYRTVYLSREEVKDTTEEVVVAEEEFDPVKELLKWVVISVFLLCFLWGGFYLVKYIMDPHVKTVSELQNYGLQVIGRIGKEEQSLGWIDRLDYKRKGNYDTMEYIVSAINALHAQKLLLCLDQNHAELKELAEEIEKSSVGVMINNPVHLDSGALEMAKKMDGIILMINMKNELRKELQRELDVCKIQDIPVSGVIVVDEM